MLHRLLASLGHSRIGHQQGGRHGAVRAAAHGDRNTPRARSRLPSLLLLIVVVVTPVLLLTEIVALQAIEISRSLAPAINGVLETLDEPGPTLDWIPLWDRLEPYADLITMKLGEPDESGRRRPARSPIGPGQPVGG